VIEQQRRSDADVSAPQHPSDRDFNDVQAPQVATVSPQLSIRISAIHPI